MILVVYNVILSNIFVTYISNKPVNDLNWNQKSLVLNRKQPTALYVSWDWRSGVGRGAEKSWRCGGSGITKQGLVFRDLNLYKVGRLFTSSAFLKLPVQEYFYRKYQKHYAPLDCHVQISESGNCSISKYEAVTGNYVIPYPLAPSRYIKVKLK